jgi:site-specific DNA-adenine methylase
MHPTCTEIWEPFCGGGAVTLALSKVGFKVHASDNHEDLILMWQAACAGDSAVFSSVSEDELEEHKI